MENSSLLVLVENSTQSCANFINNYTEKIVIKSTDLSNENLKNSVFTKAVIEAENKDILEKLAAVAFDVLGAGAEIYIFSNDLAVTKRKLRIAGFSIEDGENFPVVGKKTVMAGSKVTLKLPEASKEDDDIVDEDALLEEDDFKKPTAEQLSAGCAPPEDGKKRRACKNCSCGLAEQEEKQKMESISSAPKSSCGNCALGDAFRCSTCPYLGQPPFKPGETVKIANFDDF